MAIQHDHDRRTKTSTARVPLNAIVAGLALTLALVAAQSPFF